MQTLPLPTLLAALPRAIATTRELNKRLSPGKVWTTRLPDGEMDIKAGLLYEGAVVAVLHFNPRNGSLLPMGIIPRVYQSNVRIQAVKSRLAKLIPDLKILPAAEFMQPETSWSFPVARGNTIVAHLKVYYDGIHVVQDYAANQEMIFYGQ